MNTDRCGNTCGRECTKGSRKEAKIQELMYRDTTYVGHAICDCTGNNWSHCNSNKGQQHLERHT